MLKEKYILETSYIRKEKWFNANVFRFHHRKLWKTGKVNWKQVEMENNEEKKLIKQKRKNNWEYPSNWKLVLWKYKQINKPFSYINQERGHRLPYQQWKWSYRHKSCRHEKDNERMLWKILYQQMLKCIWNRQIFLKTPTFQNWNNERESASVLYTKEIEFLIKKFPIRKLIKHSRTKITWFLFRK